jgi:hypothetical protein
LVLDCWYLGLSSGYMTVRAIQFIFISVLNIGRIDRPIFAEGVAKVGPVILDSYPISFRKDLLQHEAHRYVHQVKIVTKESLILFILSHNVWHIMIKCFSMLTDIRI